MKCAAYIRMSSSAQEHSPAQQRKAIEDLARRKGYRIVRTYEDLGVSGDRTDRRPQFRQMISDGAANAFDRILCWDRSRWGRFDSIDAGRWIAPLRDAGIVLETVSDGEEDWESLGGRIKVAVTAEGKNEFCKDLAQAVIRGMTNKWEAQRGYCGPTPYGYSRATRVEGKSYISTLSLHPDRAAIVKTIFTEYVKPAGSVGGIAAMLNDRGVAPSRRGLWRRAAVERILRNEAYTGTALWGRTQKGRHFVRSAGGTIQKRRRGVALEAIEPLRREGAIPAIIDKATWQLAQELLAARSKARCAPVCLRPLAGVVHCRKCGSVMHAADANSLRCSGSQPSRGKRRQCSGARVAAGPILKAIIDGLSERLGSPAGRKAIAEGLARRLASPEIRGQRKALVARRDRLAGEIATGLDRLTTLSATLAAELTKRLEAKAAERDRLTAEIEAMPEVASLTPAATVKRIMDRLDDLLRDALHGGDAATVNAALKAFRVRVVTEPGASDAEITIGDEDTTSPGCGVIPRLAWRVSAA